MNNTHIPTIEIFRSQFINNELYSCQIVTTILAIENLMGKNSNGISIYQKWIRSRGKRDIKEATFSLINLFMSIYSKGYDENFPLSVNKKTNAMFGGAHRLGICLFLGIRTVPCTKIDNEKTIPKKYDFNYFKNILTDSEFKTLVDKVTALREVL